MTLHWVSLRPRPAQQERGGVREPQDLLARRSAVLQPKHPCKWHWSQSLACSQDSSGCIPWQEEEEEDFPDQTPPIASLSCVDQEKIWGGSTTQCRRWQWEEQGHVRWDSCNVTLVPSGPGGEAEPGSTPGKGRRIPGVSWGPAPSVDGLVLRVAPPLSQQQHAAAQQQHGQGRAQRHGRDGDHQRGEGVPGGLPKAQQHRPVGGDSTAQDRAGVGSVLRGSGQDPSHEALPGAVQPLLEGYERLWNGE